MRRTEPQKSPWVFCSLIMYMNGLSTRNVADWMSLGMDLNPIDMPEMYTIDIRQGTQARDDRSSCTFN